MQILGSNDAFDKAAKVHQQILANRFHDASGKCLLTSQRYFHLGPAVFHWWVDGPEREKLPFRARFLDVLHEYTNLQTSLCIIMRWYGDQNIAVLDRKIDVRSEGLLVHWRLWRKAISMDSVQVFSPPRFHFKKCELATERVERCRSAIKRALYLHYSEVSGQNATPTPSIGGSLNVWPIRIGSPLRGKRLACLFQRM